MSLDVLKRIFRKIFSAIQYQFPLCFIDIGTASSFKLEDPK